MAAGKIGSVWADESWSDTSWTANTWATASASGGVATARYTFSLGLRIGLSILLMLTIGG